MANSTHESLLHRFFLRLWYRPVPSLFARCLYPLSLLLSFFAKRRRQRLSETAASFRVPVVVVGNISVGGTGKTPVIIALANTLTSEGIHVGIVSRGYGSKAANYPYSVKPQSSVVESGDEALLIARETQCPVVIDSQRVFAVEHLLKAHPNTQLILSDDGLQHYHLYRNYEIVVLDGNKGLGNGYCLPAGPLRESKVRLNDVDAVLVNGQPNDSLVKHIKPLMPSVIMLKPISWAPVCDGDELAIATVPWQGPVIAVAGIGNPQRFFDTLASLGIEFTPVIFDDHHDFRPSDFINFVDSPIVMTSKDAVKCVSFAQENWWQLKVECVLPDTLIQSVKNQV